MSVVNFETYVQQEKEKNAKNNNFQKKEFKKVGYLNSLKDDGDEVIVRFAYDDPSQFDIVTAHREMVNGKYRYVSCLRNAYEPLTKCPLCERGDQVTSRFFVKVLVYELDENGNISANGKVWDRPISFAHKLSDYCKEYENLSDYIFKIKRRGEKGSLKTEYEIVPTNPNVYKQDIYVKDFSCFETLDLAHHSYYDKSYDEVLNFVKTGNFSGEEEVKPQEQPQEPAQEQAPEQKEQYTYVYTRPQVQEASKERPQVDPTFRPRRY